MYAWNHSGIVTTYCPQICMSKAHLLRIICFWLHEPSFHYNCKFLITQKRCAEQGREGMISVRKSTSSLYLNIYAMLRLFDIYVCSILMYGCEE